MANYGYPKYQSAAERKLKAKKAVARLMKKDPSIQPIEINGRKLASTWWGKAWNENLERYADYENRIGRGRSYVRDGLVVDLRIELGTVYAKVQGTKLKPYEVQIDIAPIDANIWEKIKKDCEGKIDSLQELIKGNIPKTLVELFTEKGQGLFPAPDEISMHCDCPDWASMCKHISATFYAIGARLDQDSSLFFTLRNANVNELVQQVVDDTTKDMLKKAGAKSGRTLDDASIKDIFDVDL